MAILSAYSKCILNHVLDSANFSIRLIAQRLHEEKVLAMTGTVLEAISSA
jgi:hypothetical protein